MAIDSATKNRMKSVFRTPEDTKTMIAAIDSMGSGPAAAVAAIPASTNIPVAALSTSNTYTDAAVNAAVNAGVAVTESRLDAAEAKVNAVIAALKAAGLMST